MKRDPAAMTAREYDLLVIGAGIHGANVAWDAALRGLGVALVDKGDFVSGNSANTLKIVHGGLRYLQQANLARMRLSIRERKTLMRSAPHLVRPLPCLTPTYRSPTKGRLAMRLAMAINDLVGFDRNRGADPPQRIPAGRILSRDECLRKIPGLDGRGVTGGALWHDALMHNSERLVLSIIKSAVRAGAEAANYVEATGLLTEGERVVGMRARDLLGGDEFDIRAGVVVNASGPRLDDVIALSQNRQRERRIKLSTAINLVVSRPLVTEAAVGFRSSSEFERPGGTGGRGSRMLFAVPWRGRALVGTRHAPLDCEPGEFRVSEEQIADFLEEVNRALPSAAINRHEVTFHHWGIVPMDGLHPKNGEVILSKRPRIFDHGRDEGLDGLISLVGVKSTTARAVAERTVDLACRKLDIEPPRCGTAKAAVAGGQIERFDEYLDTETGKKPRGLDAEVTRHLVYTYGSDYAEILDYIDEEPEWGRTAPGSSEVLMAEVVHGVREEMAVKLADVVLRRTELGSAGHTGEPCLEECAAVMAAELGWDEAKKRREIGEVRDIYTPAV